MSENEFRVRPVMRYNVTHYLSDGQSGSCMSLGEFTSLEAAERVALAMHKNDPSSTFATVFKGAESGGPKPDRFPHAIASLKVALHTVENNEPINRAEGKNAQADLEAEVASDIRAALSAIESEQTMPASNSQADWERHIREQRVIEQVRAQQDCNEQAR